MKAIAIILSLAVAGTAWAAPKKRELRRRTVTVTDDANAVPEIHLGAPYPTTLVFPSQLKPDGVLMVDVKGHIRTPEVADTSVILLPKRDLPPGYVATLQITMANGAVVPFKLTSARGELDLMVDVQLDIVRGAPESPAALKAQIQTLRGQLDECSAGAGAAGISKLASLILAKDVKDKHPFERHEIRKLSKQSRLLVEARTVYRLLGLSFVVLTVENREPSKSWVLNRPEIRVVGAGASSEVKVLTFATEMQALPPGEEEKLVLVFESPMRQKGQRIDVSLQEKDGNRHVLLEDVPL